MKEDGNAIDYGDPTGKERRDAIFRAEMDFMAMMSACSSEILGAEPTDTHFENFEMYE